ncbi:MAG: outer membrane protein assembly factor BamD [Bacteroidetes bacterium]|nr:outer membrane protein assembly factor BamD [Bacteroidota bacterium]
MTSFFRIVPLLCTAAVLLACSSSDLPENPTAEQQFRLGMEEFQDENYQEAAQHFEVIRLQYPGSSVADSARYFTALSRFKREEYLLASYEFNQIIQSGASRELMADSYYQFAQCYYQLAPKVDLDQTYTMRAIDALQNFVEAYPQHEKAQSVEKQVIELVNRLAEKEYNTGILYEKMEVPESALIYFSTVVDRYYNTDYADDAMAGKVRSLLAMKRYSDAIAAAKEFAEKYPSSEYKSDVESYMADAAARLRQSSELR